MEVKWLNTALNNLEREVEYISKENSDAAKKVVQIIHNSVSLLENNPSYIIPYRACNNRVELLRVFHTSRKLPKPMVA